MVLPVVMMVVMMGPAPFVALFQEGLFPVGHENQGFDHKGHRFHIRQHFPDVNKIEVVGAPDR